MPNWLNRLKPGVPARTHLFLASALWTTVGLLLLLRGWRYLNDDKALPLAILGIILGSLKSRYLLDRAAMKGVQRIQRFGDNTCIGAVYSWHTWLLVLAMMLGGWLLRRSPLPPAAIGVIISAIGWALLISSRHGWRHWLAGHNR